MEKRLHMLTFWAINGALDTRRLKEQLRERKKCGFDGTIFQPRYYPGRPGAPRIFPGALPDAVRIRIRFHWSGRITRLSQTAG